MVSGGAVEMRVADGERTGRQQVDGGQEEASHDVDKRPRVAAYTTAQAIELSGHDRNSLSCCGCRWPGGPDLSESKLPICRLAIVCKPFDGWPMPVAPGTIRPRK